MKPTLTPRFASLKIAALLAVTLAPAIHAQTFRTIPELTFTRQFGAQNPLPQNLMVASTGANFRFNVTVSTSTGGAWLTATGCTSSCDTPHYLTVSVVAGVTLPAGSYSGQILLKEHFSNSTSITIPVTLTIAPAGEAVLDNLPGQMSFTYKAGQNPPAQSFQIRNAGPATLAWTMSTSTADGGSWLSASSSSGNAPSSTTISLIKGNLPGAGAVAGTYIGQLRINAGGRSTTIPVSVIVGDNVFAQINAISFSKSFGGADPLPQVLTVTSTGAQFRANVVSNTARGDDWLTVSGCVSSCDTPHAITVSVNPLVTLPAGTYTGQVVLREHFSGTMAMTIPVTLTIAAGGAAVLDNLPGQISFSMKTANSALISHDVQVRNAVPGAISWTASLSTADGGPWLSISAPSGSTPMFVTVSVAIASLPNGGITAGTFTGQIVFQHSGGSVTVPISVVVGANVFRQVNALHFTKTFGGVNPLPQTVTIASTGSQFRANIAASTANGGNWLTVTGCVSSCDTPSVIYVTIAAAPTLAAGTYTGQIVVKEHFTGTMAMTIPVTLTVNAAGAALFDNMPGQMSFFVKTGSLSSPPAPPGQDISVRSAGPSPLSWTLTTSTSDGGAWLNASINSGSTPATVRISIVPSALPDLGLVAGTFTGEVVFSTAAGRVTIPVSAIVGAGVFRQVNGISFVKPFGAADPLPQILTIASTGANFRANVRVNSGNGGDWLTVNGCVSSCDTPHVIRAVVSASPTLPAGVYTAQIVVTEHFNGTMAMTIPVTLTVASGGAFFDNVQGQLGFSKTVGAANPASLEVELRNGGSGSLAWTIETSTADSGNWLTVSANSGTTAAGSPALINVGVVTSALPDLGLVAATYTGQLLFKSTSGTLTIPVSVTVGANVFQHVTPLRFTRGFGATNPLPQTFSAASTAAAFRLNATDHTGTGGDWLSISGCTSSCDTPSNISASIIAPPTIPAGTYTGQIVLEEHFNGTMAHTVPVILTITGAPCTYGIAPTSASAAATGATGSVTVTPSNSGCAWTATSNAAWITVTSGASGTGNGSVGYSVAANTGAARSGTITIAGQTFTVNQAAAAGPGCSLSSTSASYIHVPAADAVSVINGGSCGAWTAVSNATWITVISGASGTGAGSVGFSIAQNDGVSARVGTITIAGLTLTINQSASTIRVVDPNPASGSGSNRTFTFTFTDTNGFADLTVLNVLINNALDAKDACYIAYIRSINTLVLVNDAGASGGPYVGSLVFPTSASIANSQCTINGAGSSATTSGNSLFLTLNITFSGSFSGRRVVWAAGRDTGGDNTGWRSKAVWDVPGAATDPAVISVTPSRADASAVTISATFSDSGGATDLSILNLLINNAVDGRRACYLAYIRSINTLALVDDAGNAGGPFAGTSVVPGTSTISNSQCSINMAASSVSTIGNNLVLTLQISFPPGFGGDKIVYAAARDNGVGNSGWQAAGTITVR